MGADFKEKAKRTFEKSWDKAAVLANTPDLFTKSVEARPPLYEAEAIGNAIISSGDTFCVRNNKGKLIGYNGITPTISIPAPTNDLLQAISKGCNVAMAEVVNFDTISGVADVKIR